jgi:hypothetical protein
MEEPMAEGTVKNKNSVISEIGLPMMILLALIPLYYFAPIFDHRTDTGICRFGVFADLKP